MTDDPRTGAPFWTAPNTAEQKCDGFFLEEPDKV
jgi:hypothetical protein